MAVGPCSFSRWQRTESEHRQTYMANTDTAPPLTIGVRGSGPGAGKDAAADIICEALTARGFAPRREQFATPLRECVEALTGVAVAESQTSGGKNRRLPGWDMSVGQMMQRLGTDAIRNHLRSDAWVLALFRRFGETETVVISDVRFPNEVEAVRRRQGVVINIIRPSAARGAGGQTAALAGRDPDHVSERALDGTEADHVVTNDGTLEDLRDRVLALVDRLYPVDD